MIGAIWAQNPHGIIGRGGKIPWRYAGDFARFKRVTMGASIVMGRRTWESIGKKLPGRTNIVVSTTMQAHPDVLIAASIDRALALTGPENVWFIGGRAVYEAAMPLVEIIDVTYVPDDVVRDEHTVHAPVIDTIVFAPGAIVQHEDEPTLTRCVFTRRVAP